MEEKDFIILYFNSQILCKACLDVMRTDFNKDHSKIIVTHYPRGCEFDSSTKEVSCKVFEIE